MSTPSKLLSKANYAKSVPTLVALEAMVVGHSPAPKAEMRT